MAKKTKKIKGYALVHRETPNIIEDEEYFCSYGCCCRQEAMSMAIYKNKRDAEDRTKYYSTYEIIPVIITPIVSKSKKIK